MSLDYLTKDTDYSMNKKDDLDGKLSDGELSDTSLEDFLKENCDVSLVDDYESKNLYDSDDLKDNVVSKVGKYQLGENILGVFFRYSRPNIIFTNNEAVRNNRILREKVEYHEKMHRFPDKSEEVVRKITGTEDVTPFTSYAKYGA